MRVTGGAGQSARMKRREWIKRLGGAVAGVAVATRLGGRALAMNPGVRRPTTEAASTGDTTAAPRGRELTRRYVHGFETELMR